MKCQHNEQTLKYLESDEFFVKIDMKWEKNEWKMCWKYKNECKQTSGSENFEFGK